MSGSKSAVNVRGLTTALNRNQACLTCRKRKVRCDAIKPACGACRVTARSNNVDPNLLCTYPPQTKESDNKQSQVQEPVKKKSKKDGELPNSITTKDVNSTGNNSVSGFHTIPHTGISTVTTTQPEMSSITSQNSFDPMDSMLTNPLFTRSNPTIAMNGEHTTPFPLSGIKALDEFLTFDMSASNYLFSGQEDLIDSLNSIGNTVNTSTSATTNSTISNSPDHWNNSHGSGSSDTNNVATGATQPSQLAPPSVPATALQPPPLIPQKHQQEPTPQNGPVEGDQWPETLAPYSITRKLLELYFEIPHSSSGTLDEDKFWKQFSYSPSHPFFPNLCLIHAMCAITTMMKCPYELSFVYDATYWKSSSSPTVYHGVQCKAIIDRYHNAGICDLQYLQALLLVCAHCYLHAQFALVWNYAGVVTRNALNLALNHLERSYEVNEDGTARRAGQMVLASPNSVFPPVNESERRERAYLFYMILTADRFTSAQTGWAHGISDEDISTFLPTRYNNGGKLQDPTINFDALSPDSPTFFTNHPEDLVGSTQLFFKAVCLFGRAQSYIQRNATKLCVRDKVSGRMKPTADPRRLSGFRTLEELVSSFQTSFPLHLDDSKEVTHKRVVKSRHALAKILPHATIICLHENFVKDKQSDPSARKCLDAARAIWNIANPVWSDQHGESLEAYVVSVLSIAGRAFARELIRKSKLKDKVAMQKVEEELDSVLTLLKREDQPTRALVAEWLFQTKRDARTQSDLRFAR